MVTKVLKLADIILPGAAYTEQDGYLYQFRGKNSKSL